MTAKRFADMTPAEREAVRAARRAEEAERFARGKEHAKVHPVPPEERERLSKILGPISDVLNGRTK